MPQTHAYTWNDGRNGVGKTVLFSFKFYNYKSLIFFVSLQPINLNFMINYIKGKIVEKNPAYVVLETAAGIGFYINISVATYSQLKDDEEVKLLTYYIVKEDSQTLYGFVEEEERELFKLLLSVNGIGPNTSRLILSSMSVGEVLNAIATENVKAIQSVKGIGAKTAQRVVIELKDKAKKVELSNPSKIAVAYNNNKYDALTALIALGFPKAGAESVLDKIIKAEGINLTVEELIKKSLKLL